jgi:hypothetical protein
MLALKDRKINEIRSGTVGNNVIVKCRRNRQKVLLDDLKEKLQTLWGTEVETLEQKVCMR